MLTAKQEAFARARADPACRSDSDAYRKAYNAEKMTLASINRAAADLVINPKVTTRIKELLREQTRELYVDAEFVLREWVTIALADPTELMETRHDACRYCWGEGHAYQWRDEAEYCEAVAAVLDCNNAKAQRKGSAPEEPLPMFDGGVGFKKSRGPHPDCPKCEGVGELFVYLADMRKVSPAGRKLFAGVKQTANGIEIKTRDQTAALESIARHLGMYTENLRLIIPGGSLDHTVTHALDESAAARVYQTAISAG